MGLSEARLAARVTGSSPLHDVAGVEAFSAQEGALVAIPCTGVVLLDDAQLVLGGEGSPPRLIGQGGAVFSHHLIMGALHQLGWHGHCGLPGPVSPLRDGGVPQVSQVMLTERVARSPTPGAVARTELPAGIQG